MSFDPEKYIPTIDALLGVTDLESISAKKIRRSIQELLGIDLNPYKKDIDDVIIERYVKILQHRALQETKTTQKDTKEGRRAEVEDDDEEEEEEEEEADDDDDDDDDQEEDTRRSSSTVSSASPGKTTGLKESDNIKGYDDDAALAAKLHSEWNQRYLRDTRKVVKRKRSAARPKVKKELTEAQKKNPFQQPLLLSPQLSMILGESELSRPQAVKALWKYIKANNLQNPDNKREIICDEHMRAVFGDKTDIFGMNSILTGHLYKKDEVM